MVYSHQYDRGSMLGEKWCSGVEEGDGGDVPSISTSLGCRLVPRHLEQMHCPIQDQVASGMGTGNRLTVRMVAKMLAMEVLLEVAARRGGLQLIKGW